MGENKLRIPRLAVASLVLGGACDDGKSSTDVGAARVQRIAERICRQQFMCDPESDGTEVECVDDGVEELSSEIERDRRCGEALLDYYECYASLPCEESEEDDKCYAAGVAADEACEDDD